MTLWLHLRGPISKGRGGEGERRVNEGEKKGRKKEFGPPPNLHHRSTPLAAVPFLSCHRPVIGLVSGDSLGRSLLPAFGSATKLAVSLRFTDDLEQRKADLLTYSRLRLRSTVRACYYATVRNIRSLSLTAK